MNYRSDSFSKWNSEQDLYVVHNLPKGRIVRDHGAVQVQLNEKSYQHIEKIGKTVQYLLAIVFQPFYFTLYSIPKYIFDLIAPPIKKVYDKLYAYYLKLKNRLKRMQVALGNKFFAAFRFAKKLAEPYILKAKARYHKILAPLKSYYLQGKNLLFKYHYNLQRNLIRINLILNALVKQVKEALLETRQRFIG